MIAPQKNTIQQTASRNRNFMKPAIMAVVCLAAIVAVVIMPKGGKDDAATEKAKPELPVKDIEMSKPQPASKPPENEPPATKGEDEIKPKFDSNGKWIKPANWDKLSLQDRTRSMPIGRTISRRPEKPLFKNASDVKIFRLLHTKPGAPLLGTMRYDQRFVNDFLASLKEPVIYDKDDSEEDKRAKIAVQQARRELKAAYDRGEDIVEIMRETEDELHKLAIYKINLQGEVQKALQSGNLTDDEVRDFAQAANILLEEKGLDPIRLPRFYLIREQMHKGDKQ